MASPFVCKVRALPVIVIISFLVGYVARTLVVQTRAQHTAAVEGVLWDGERPVAGPRPWKEWCRFFEVKQPSHPSYTMCLRDSGDPESDAVRGLGRFARCDDLLVQWKERLLARGETDVFVDVGAGMGGCTLFMATEGISSIAVEGDPANLFRLTSSVLANPPRGNVTVYSVDASRAVRGTGTTLDDCLAGLKRTVRLLRIAETEDARRVLEGAHNLMAARKVRSVKLEARNSTLSVAACRMLESRGYTLYRSGRPLASSAECGSDTLEPHDVVAHLV
jgi:precorrin-6B methylase 2